MGNCISSSKPIKQTTVDRSNIIDDQITQIEEGVSFSNRITQIPSPSVLNTDNRFIDSQLFPLPLLIIDESNNHQNTYHSGSSTCLKFKAVPNLLWSQIDICTDRHTGLSSTYAIPKEYIVCDFILSYQECKKLSLSQLINKVSIVPNSISKTKDFIFNINQIKTDSIMSISIPIIPNLPDLSYSKFRNVDDECLVFIKIIGIVQGLLILSKFYYEIKNEIHRIIRPSDSNSFSDEFLFSIFLISTCKMLNIDDKILENLTNCENGLFSRIINGFSILTDGLISEDDVDNLSININTQSSSILHPIIPKNMFNEVCFIMDFNAYQAIPVKSLYKLDIFKIFEDKNNLNTIPEYLTPIIHLLRGDELERLASKIPKDQRLLDVCDKDDESDEISWTNYLDAAFIEYVHAFQKSRQIKLLFGISKYFTNPFYHEVFLRVLRVATKLKDRPHMEYYSDLSSQIPIIYNEYKISHSVGPAMEKKDFINIVQNEVDRRCLKFNFISELENLNVSKMPPLVSAVVSKGDVFVTGKFNGSTIGLYSGPRVLRLLSHSKIRGKFITGCNDNFAICTPNNSIYLFNEHNHTNLYVNMSLKNEKIKEIISTSSSFVFLTENGGVYLIGESVYSDDVLNVSKYPIFQEISFPTQILKISSGSFHCVGIDVNGQVYSWGRNDGGQLGIGDDYLDSIIETPQIVKFNESKVVTIVDIACGDAHTICLAKVGESTNTTRTMIYGWGWSEFGQIGSGETTTTTSELKKQENSPIQITSIPDNISSMTSRVFAGGAYSSIQLHNGDLYSFGDNHVGQLGIGSKDILNTWTPVRVKIAKIDENLDGIWRLECAPTYVVAINVVSGNVWIWGTMPTMQDKIWSPTKIDAISQIDFDSVACCESFFALVVA